ncbi:MAG: class IV adenylate cyclase [Flavihumibacter sp.]|nr:class IV adenylate cyclase [Flavihumibacter sp.]
MSFTNIEIKARTVRVDAIRSFLLQQNVRVVGTDTQTDTYFNCAKGRLKLRQGSIENSLIFYERENVAGPRVSSFELVPVTDGAALLKLLTRAHGIKVQVVKQREIFYIDNVKFHLDRVEGLGTFVEIEAGNVLKDVPVEMLQEQCAFYVNAFEIKEGDMLAVSYSDMLLNKV